MRIEGDIFKNEETGRYWAVVIPALGIHTQGTSKKDALAMAKDAVETVVGDAGVTVASTKDGFTVSCADQRMLFAAILKRQRALAGLSAATVARRIGQRSETGVLRYEQGRTKISFEKFSEIISAVNPALDPILKIG